MQSNSKQIGTLPGDHNKPGGPANRKESNECIKKEKRDMRRAAAENV